MWERYFVATSVLLSVPLDEALAGLPSGSEMRSVTRSAGGAEARVAELVAKLRDGRRAVRASALADVGKEIAMAVAEITRR